MKRNFFNEKYKSVLFSFDFVCSLLAAIILEEYRYVIVKQQLSYRVERNLFKLKYRTGPI